MQNLNISESGPGFSSTSPLKRIDLKNDPLSVVHIEKRAHYITITIQKHYFSYNSTTAVATELNQYYNSHIPSHMKHLFATGVRMSKNVQYEAIRGFKV